MIRHSPGCGSTVQMKPSPSHGVALAVVFLLAGLGGCGRIGALDDPSSALPPTIDATTAHPTQTVPPTQTAPVIPADVAAPVLACGGALGTLALKLPCELGQAPVSEVDCSFGGAAAGQKLAFLLPLSLPEASGGAGLTLGAPTRFHASLLPYGRPAFSNGRYVVSDVSGTVTFTSFSLADQKLDGWFPHLDVVLTGQDGSVLSCSLDAGRFTAVPGRFL
jgi:hypothetical protein